MRNFKNKCLGGVAVMSVLTCANLVQASTTQVAPPQVTFHHSQVSSNKVNVDLGMTNLSDEVIALEVSIVADDIQTVLAATSKVSNSYITYQLQTLQDGKEKLTLYIISDDKDTPLALQNNKLQAVSFSLQTGGKLTLDETQTMIKVIEKGYNTQTYNAVDLVYTEDAYKPSTDTGNTGGNNNSGSNNNNSGSNNGNNNGNNNIGNNNNNVDDDDDDANNSNNNTTNNNDSTNDKDTNNDVNEEINNTPVVEANFTDIENHWAQSAIANMVNKGVIKGYADGTFKPNASITRGEFATLLARAFNLTSSNQNNPFADVNSEKWYADGVLALYEAGITSGRPDGTFGVNAPITNEEICAMLYRTITVLNMNIAESNTAGINFTDDAKISNYAKEAVTSLVKMGIISGQPDGSFGPKSSTSRAQVAVMLDRVFTLVSE